MNSARLMSVTLGAFLILTMAADAQAGRADRRQNRQSGRIVHGIKSNELTKRETAGLAAGQVKINRAEHRFESSGDGLNRREKRKLERMQDRQSRKIWRKKHNRRDAE